MPIISAPRMLVEGRLSGPTRLGVEDGTITSLDPLICPCSTMFRIDGPHLAWVLEALVRGEVVNQITVDPQTTEWARVALQRMLDIT